MKINRSPWIHELDKNRKIETLKQDLDTDVAIVGAGIAGISTAFFILKYTQERVVILEQGRLAHGATGHNAGHVVARFERPLHELVTEFGFAKVKSALHDLNSAWLLLDEMYTDAHLDVPFTRVSGSRGFSDLHQVITTCKDIEVEIHSGLEPDILLLSEDAPFRESIPKALEKYYKVVPHKEVLEKLETNDKIYHAVAVDQSACMNSALFCQEVCAYLLREFPKRFSLYEETPILKTLLKDNFTLLDAGKHTINASRVVLCTNGFEKLDIINEGGLAIDKRFHHLVRGTVGYMSGYLEPLNKPPMGAAYYGTDDDPSKDDPYFYVTRRQHDVEDKKHNLICVGGPEITIEDREEYLNDYDYPERMQTDIEDFVRKTYGTGSEKKVDYQFTWHGLMGYTPNRVRLVGVEPKNPVLLYNLGCNGIGIIPSIFGGRRIARLIAREKLPPSIFDPQVE